MAGSPFLLRSFRGLSSAMPDADQKLTPADPRDLADAVAFALRFEGRRRVHNANEYMAAIAGGRVVRHLERGLRRHERASSS